MKFTSEFTVGMITVLAIALLVIVTFQLQSFDIFSKQYKMYAEFITTRGLEAGAPVQVNGVPVGKVTQVKRISGPQHVQVQFSIPKEIDLYTNATMRVSTSGMMGEKYLDITPGSRESGKLVQASHTFIGQSAVELDQVLDQTPEIMNDLGETLVVIRDFVKDKDNVAAVRGTLANVRSITHQIDSVLTTSSANINRMVANLDDTAKGLRELTANVNSFVTDLKRDFDRSRETVAKRYEDFSTKTSSILTNVNSLTGRLDEVAGRLNAAIAEGQPKAREISDNISRMTRELTNLSEGINQGRGTIGKLVIDPRPFEDLRAILERLRAIVEGGAGTLRTEIHYESLGDEKNRALSGSATPSPNVAPSASATPAAKPRLP